VFLAKNKLRVTRCSLKTTTTKNKQTETLLLWQYRTGSICDKKCKLLNYIHCVQSFAWSWCNLQPRAYEKSYPFTSFLLVWYCVTQLSTDLWSIFNYYARK